MGSDAEYAWWRKKQEERQQLWARLSGGVFISPNGEIIFISTTHIKYVIENPSKFGVSLDWIKDVFARHGEGLGMEGNARDEVVATLIANDWIRIRYHPSDVTYHIELRRLNGKNKNSLYEWASQTINRSPDKATAKVVISEVTAGKPYFESHFELSDLLDSHKFVSSGKVPKVPTYTIARVTGGNSTGHAPKQITVVLASEESLEKLVAVLSAHLNKTVQFVRETESGDTRNVYLNGVLDPDMKIVKEYNYYFAMRREEV